MIAQLLFHIEVAKRRFASAVETTIEAKHAAVSKAAKGRCVGSVRMSLANRLPMFEIWLVQGVVNMQDAVEQFSLARSLKKVPALLDIEKPPMFQNRCRRRPETQLENQAGPSHIPLPS